MWTTIFFASGAILCVLSLGMSLFAVRFVTRVTAFPLAKLASVESKLESLALCHSETQAALEVTANRLKMTRVRNAANHVSDPTPANVDELKAQLRRKAGLVAGRPANHREN